MSSEASNIIRRFLLVIFDLEHESLGYARVCARSLAPDDLRKLADEVYDNRGLRQRAPIAEIRGIARAIVRYGGADKVMRDADPELVAALKKVAW